jgi:hypothetical protein
MNKSKDIPISVKHIQEIKQKMTSAFTKYLNEHDIKNKKNIAMLIKEFNDVNYSKFSSGKMLSGGSNKIVTSKNGMLSSRSVILMDYCAFVILFGAVIASILIYNNFMDFASMMNDSDIEEKYLSFIAQVDAEDAVCGELSDNANSLTETQRNTCITNAPLMISLYQMLFYIKLFFLNTPNTILNFTHGISNHIFDRMKYIALKHANDLKDKAGDACISGVRTNVFTSAWNMVSTMIPLIPGPNGGNTMGCVKDIAMSQAAILTEEAKSEIAMFMNKLTTTINNIQCLTSWAASAYTMSVVYFMKRYKSLGGDTHNLFLDRGDQLRAENMGLIAAGNNALDSLTRQNSRRLTSNDYSAMRVFELQFELRKRGLRVTGKKQELINRLISSNTNSGGGKKTRKKKR